MPHPRKNRPRPCKATRIQCKQIASLLDSFAPDPKQMLKVTEQLGARSSYMRTILKDKQKQLEEDLIAQQVEEQEWQNPASSSHTRAPPPPPEWGLGRMQPPPQVARGTPSNPAHHYVVSRPMASQAMRSVDR
jgi:hypothetical protein